MKIVRRTNEVVVITSINAADLKKVGEVTVDHYKKDRHGVETEDIEDSYTFEYNDGGYSSSIGYALMVATKAEEGCIAFTITCASNEKTKDVLATKRGVIEKIMAFEQEAAIALATKVAEKAATEAKWDALLGDVD